MEALLDLIAQNGLGVAAAVAVAWWYMKKDKQHCEVIEKYSDRCQRINDEAHAITLERELKYQELLTLIMEKLKDD